MEQIKDLISKEDIAKEILKTVKKERMTTSEGKRIMKVAQLPPVILQKTTLLTRSVKIGYTQDTIIRCIRRRVRLFLKF